jgi:hypothetical protein
VTDLPLYDQLMDAIEQSFPDVTSSMDRHTQGGRYAILKINGKTIAYVNNKSSSRSLRVDGAKKVNGSFPNVLIANPVQIPVAIEFIEQYAKEAAAT